GVGGGKDGRYAVGQRAGPVERAVRQQRTRLVPRGDRPRRPERSARRRDRRRRDERESAERRVGPAPAGREPDARQPARRRRAAGESVRREAGIAIGRRVRASPPDVREGSAARPARRAAYAFKAGRRSPTRVADSNARAIARTPASLPLAPAICSPTGRPSRVKPAGTEIAGPYVALIQYADFIHEM